jgi:hypothetical protein
MLESIDLLLDYDSPLVFEFKGESCKMPNLNTFSFKELRDLLNALKTYKGLTDWLTPFFPKDLAKSLSERQKIAIFENIQKHSGFTISDVSLLFVTIEKYTDELSQDLLNKNLTLFDLIKMKPLEGLLVFRSLLKTNERSALIAAINNWSQPFGLQDFILSDLIRLTIQVNSQKPNDVPADVYPRLPFPKQSDSFAEFDKLNEGVENEPELTDEEIEILSEKLLKAVMPSEVEDVTDIKKDEPVSKVQQEIDKINKAKKTKKRKPQTEEQKKRYAANRAAKRQELKQLTDKVISKNLGD